MPPTLSLCGEFTQEVIPPSLFKSFMAKFEEANDASFCFGI